MLYSLNHILAFLSLFLGCIFPADLIAQAPYLKGTISAGHIIKHRTEIIFDNDALSYGAEVSLVWQTKGQKSWHQLQNFPRLSLGLKYHSLGDKDVVGDAIGLRAIIDIPLFRKEKSAMYFSLSSGIAYLTQPFDRINNQENNAIGSHWNSSVDIKFEYERKLNDKIKIHFGLGLSHYSNGARKLPNLGLNLPQAFIGISPYIGSYEKDYFTFSDIRKEAKRKWGFAFQLQYTQVQIRLPGGPNFPTYIAALEGNYYPNKNLRWSVGYQYSFNSSIAEFGLQTGGFLTRQDVINGASRHSLTLGNEFLFGPWSVQLKSGVYIRTQKSFLLPLPYYFQLATRYTFNPRSESLKLYTGLNLKSHLFTAEFLSWSVGVVF